MYSERTFPRSLLKLPVSALVKSSAIPSNPIDDLNIDLNKPIVYALPFRSNTDLLTLQTSALAAGLPDPLSPIEINGKKLDRFVYISSQPTLLNDDKHIPSASIALFTELLRMHRDNPDLDFQVIPTTVLWGRKPGKEGEHKPFLQAMNGLQKARAVLFAGRDCMVRFSPCVSLRYMADSHGSDSAIAHKLARATYWMLREQVAFEARRLFT